MLITKTVALAVLAAYEAHELQAQGPIVSKCTYRSEHGPCAVGVVLTDDEAAADPTVHTIPCDDSDWLSALQHRHDVWARGWHDGEARFLQHLNQKLPS